MAITDHVAILTHAALAEAVPNRKKAGNPLQFYALVAFPPAAANDIADILRKVAPGGSLDGLNINVKANSKQRKPIPGVPNDWLVFRASSQYAPYVADMHGKQLLQGPDGATIRAKFYAGKKVRVALSAYYWPDKGEGPGISFNLDGVMEAGDGERLAIGSGVTASAFEKYADKSAPAETSQPAQNNPFGGTPTPAASSGDNPFAQTGAAAGAAAKPFG